jgi:hypothetical protein
MDQFHRARRRGVSDAKGNSKGATVLSDASTILAVSALDNLLASNRTDRKRGVPS